MARRSKYGPSITYSGPLFEKDVTKTFRGNARTLVLAIAKDGERMVREGIPRSSVAPHYADFVVGTAGALPGKGKDKWALTAAVRGSLHLTAKGYKGYGRVLETNELVTRKSRSGTAYTFTGRGLWIYRRVGNALRRGSKAARADLTKGLN